MILRAGRNIIIVSVIIVSAAAVAATRDEQVNSPFENLKTEPVAVTWQYSNDGGKTFAAKPHPAPPPGQGPNIKEYPYAWKGTFAVADPSKIAGLWVRITGGGEKPRASICNGNLSDAAGGYWKDLGFCPTLLSAVITLNDKEIAFPHGAPLLQFWVPLTGEIKKGANTVELRGNVYTYWGGASYAGTVALVDALDARVISAAAQPFEIFNGPVLGDFGEGYFTVSCRSQLPAELTVEATPIEPSGQPVSVSSPGKIWHRFKVDIPKDTRRVSYTITARAGQSVTKRGPFVLTIPALKDYRFIAFGNPMQQPGCPEPLTANSKCIVKIRPDFVVNTGNLMEQESWSFDWEEAYIKPASVLLSAIPTLITPCNRDYTGIFNELHITPAADGYSRNWTKVIGPALFVGIDGNDDWSEGGKNIKWLDEVLGKSKEKFIIVLSGYPAYSSGINSKKFFGGRVTSRNVIMPLLARHKATLMLSSWDPTYERIEPTPDKGITQIVTGCIGQGGWHKWDSRFGSQPFGPGEGANPRGTLGKVVLPDGREWVGYFSTRHFCVFDVRSDAIEMKVYRAPSQGKEVNSVKDLEVIDQKTFKPRQ